MALTFYNAWRTVSSTSSNSYKEDFQAFIDVEFEESPTIKTVKHNGVDVVVRVVGKFNTETVSRNNDNYQKIIFKQSNYLVNIGDIFEFDGDKWLCTDISSTPVSKSCSVTKCTNTLNLYQNGILYQIPCVINSTITLDTDETKFIESPSTTIVLRMSNTETTRLIKRGDIYQIGLQSYIVKDINDIVEPGILKMEIEFSEQEQESHVYTLEILNGNLVDIQEGTTLQLNINVYDNGSLISPTPSLTFTSSDTEICTVNSSGLVTALNNIDSCVIIVSLVSDSSISDTININVIAVPQDNYTYTLASTSLPDTEIVVTQTKTFTAQKYNNGVAMIQSFTFSIVGDTSSYQLTVVDGNNCQVKALKSGYTITLNAVDDSDVSKMVSKEITLKNLF